MAKSKNRGIVKQIRQGTPYTVYDIGLASGESSDKSLGLSITSIELIDGKYIAYGVTNVEKYTRLEQVMSNGDLNV